MRAERRVSASETYHVYVHQPWSLHQPWSPYTMPVRRSARKLRHHTHGTTSLAPSSSHSSWRTAHTRQPDTRRPAKRPQPPGDSLRPCSAPQRAAAAQTAAAAARRGARLARLLPLRGGGQRRPLRCQRRRRRAARSLQHTNEGHSRPAEGKGARSGEPSHAKAARSVAAHLAIRRYRVLLVRGARHAGGAAVLSAQQHGARSENKIRGRASGVRRVARASGVRTAVSHPRPAGKAARRARPHRRAPARLRHESSRALRRRTCS